MNYQHFAENPVTENILDSFIAAKVNVLFIGEKGCGKSERIIQTMIKHYGKDYAYVSGSTVDPWTDVVGLPVAVKVGEHQVIQYARPDTIPDTVRGIVLDEGNRAHKKVKNAFMELIQFKSVNGRKYPNLEVVWMACNPWGNEGDDSGYDVERLDPAHMDRFHVILQVPAKPDIKYFKKTYGSHGEDAVNWWNDQGVDARKSISSRRLSYAIETYRKNIDLKFVLPSNSNVAQLTKMLGHDEHSRFYEEFEKRFKPAANAGSIPPSLMQDIKKLASPSSGELHTRYFETAINTLPTFKEYASTYMTPEQLKMWESKGVKFNTSSSSVSAPAQPNKPVMPSLPTTFGATNSTAFAGGYNPVSTSGDDKVLMHKKIVTTGKWPDGLRSELEQILVKKYYATIHDKVKADTDVLLVFDNEYDTEKGRDARRKGLLLVRGESIKFKM